MNQHQNFLLSSLLLLTLTLCGACRGASTSAAQASEADGGFRSLMRGYHSGVAKRGVRTARDEAEWQALWKEHTALILPRPDAPDVDFSREMVLGAFLGERGSAGFDIEVRRVRHAGDRIVVEAVETRPAPDRLVPQVVTHPYQFVVVPSASAEAVLELR